MTLAVGDTTERAAPCEPLRWRGDFPALAQKIHGHPLVYLDNAATTQKPRAVLDAMMRYYERDNANVHRGVHQLSVRATQEYEAARKAVQAFIHAELPEEIIFVRGATEGINLVAQSCGLSTLAPGDEIVITGLEHHSNIVPWQILCQQTGARLRVAPLDERGVVRQDQYLALLTDRTRIVAVSHVSNALGTVNPVQEMVAAAHRIGALVLVDGAQALPHQAVDVQALDADFYVFSGHKMFGPTGIGVLYGRRTLLEAMPPYQSGGEMIRSVTFEKTTYADLPNKFEAGTPNIAGAVGLGAAIGYLRTVGMASIAAHEAELLAYGTQRLCELDGVRLIGTAPRKAGVLSFVVRGIHPHDVGTVLDRYGVAVRTGHHCAQPVMDFFGVPATCRASFAFYNTRDDVDALITGLQHAIEVFG